MIRTLREKLGEALLICRDEWRILIQLVILNFFLTAGSIISFSVINALMIVEIGIQGLPPAFLVSAAVLLPYFIFYHHIEKKSSRQSLIFVSFLIYAFLIFICRHMLIMLPRDRILINILYVFSTCISLLLYFQYWSLAHHIFSPRQGKRLFPLLSMGGTTGAIAMGFSLERLTGILGGAANLLYIWSGIIIVSAFIALLICKTQIFRNQSAESRDENIIRTAIDTFNIIRTTRILRILALIVFIMSLISFILYFQFNLTIGEHIPDENSFTAFVGNFNAIVGLSILILQLFFTGRIVSKLGITKSMFIHPLLLFFPVMSSALYHASFIPVVIARYMDLMCRDTFFSTSSEAVYSSVKDEHRDRAVIFMKIIIYPLSFGIAGLCLMGLIKWQPDTYNIITATILPFIFVAWLYSVRRLKEYYIDTLFENFNSVDDNRKLDSFLALSKLGGEDALGLIRRTLKYGGSSLKSFALQIAGDMKLSIIRNDAVELLETDDMEVLSGAIKALSMLDVGNLFPLLMKTYKNRPRKIKQLILENLKTTDPTNYFINAPLLLNEEEDPMLQAFLLESIWSRKPLLTDQKELLEHLLNLESPEVKAALCRVLKHDRDNMFKNQLMKMLKDENREVVINASVSAGACGLEESIPILIENLSRPDPDISESAEKALIEIKGESAGAVRKSIASWEPAELTERKLRVIAKSGKEDAQKFLLDSVVQFDPKTVFPALFPFAKDLPDIRAFDRQERKSITTFIDYTIRNLRTEALAASFIKDHNQSNNLYGILEILLRERRIIQKKIVLTGMDLLLPTEKILTLMENIFSHNTRKRHIAIEVLDNMLPLEYKNSLIPLLEKDKLSDEINIILKEKESIPKNSRDALLVFSKTHDPMLSAWTYYAAGVLGQAEYKEAMEKAAESDNPILSEHAALGLRLLDSTV